MLPVGRGDDGRGRDRRRGGRFAAGETVLLSTDRGEPPPPPAMLDGDLRATEIYLAYWATPVASLWESCDAVDVATLALLERRLEQGEQQTSLTSSVKAYRTSLGLTWKARRAARIRIEPAGAGDVPDEPERTPVLEDQRNPETRRNLRLPDEARKGGPAIPPQPGLDWSDPYRRPDPTGSEPQQWEAKFDESCRLLEERGAKLGTGDPAVDAVLRRS